MHGSDCRLYTYYDDNDEFQPNICILLNSAGLQEAVSPCDHCSTGPSHCNVNQTCQAAVILDADSKVQTFPYMAEASVVLSLTAAEKDCFVEFDSVVIGGGGAYVLNTYGGAGSGYVEAQTFSISVKSPVLTLTVGGHNQSSLVEVGEELIVEAKPGESPNDVRAGAGSSGGGGWRGGRGGSNGSDGEDGDQKAGGRGSGLQIESLSTENFVLTPGEGGEPGHLGNQGKTWRRRRRCHCQWQTTGG